MSFFNRLFFISVSLILVSILLSLITANNQHLSFILKIFTELVNSIGVALFVANIFDFIIGTEDFVKYIREKLIDIVLSKEFITRLNPDEQKKLLKLTLKPKREIANVYSGIEDYFNMYVSQSMQLFDECYRGQMNITAVASFDKEKGRLRIDWDLNYLVYKIAEKFDPLPFWFGSDDSEHVDTTITADKSEIEILKNDSLKDVKVNDPSMSKGYTVDVPEKFNKYREINIRRRVVEYGSDHWQLFDYKTLKACHRIRIELRCEDGIKIREINTFGVQDEYQIEKNDKTARIAYNDWLSPGYGVTVLVGLDEYHK